MTFYFRYVEDIKTKSPYNNFTIKKGDLLKVIIGDHQYRTSRSIVEPLSFMEFHILRATNKVYVYHPKMYKKILLENSNKYRKLYKEFKGNQ